MSEPFHVTNEYVTYVEEEQNVPSDFWLTDDESDTNSVTAPSDISYITDDQVGDGHEEPGNDDPEDSLMDNLEIHHQEMQTNEQSKILSGTNAAPLSLEHAQVSDTLNPAPMSSCGYVVVGDNIDKNVRPSFPRDNKSTKSFYLFHIPLQLKQELIFLLYQMNNQEQHSLLRIFCQLQMTITNCYMILKF